MPSSKLTNVLACFLCMVLINPYIVQSDLTLGCCTTVQHLNSFTSVASTTAYYLIKTDHSIVNEHHICTDVHHKCNDELEVYIHLGLGRNHF